MGRVPTAILADALEVLGLPDAAMTPAIRALAGSRIAGRARTLLKVPLPPNAGQADVAPGKGGIIYDLIDNCLPGQVLVLATGDSRRSANFGGNMAEQAARLGMAGVVTDGGLRDIADLRRLGLAGFAAMASPMSSRGKLAFVAADVPVTCGGVWVRPGDYVVGDEDGVIVVPAERIDDILDACEKLEAKDALIRADLEAGISLAQAVRNHPKR